MSDAEKGGWQFAFDRLDSSRAVHHSYYVLVYEADRQKAEELAHAHGYGRSRFERLSNEWPVNENEFLERGIRPGEARKFGSPQR